MRSRRRNSDEIKKLVVDNAFHDERIRAVLLNGSRANQKIAPDKYQDFDIVFIVKELASFISDHDWTRIFGKKLIWQLPDEMMLDSVKSKNDPGFHYLMLFEDGNRIDLTLFPIDKITDQFYSDSLTIVWLDKDRLFRGINESNDLGYTIEKPTEKQFLDVCNEFWWVSTYVAKGLLRTEITYAKEMLERFVRPMFMKIVEWYAGIRTAFSVSFGKGGRFMKSYLPRAIYKKILRTYSDYHLKNNWKALFVMLKLFGFLAKSIADNLKFHYEINEEKNVTKYLKLLYREQR
jgi:aminoglycoside 6-adenylyltransferase